MNGKLFYCFVLKLLEIVECFLGEVWDAYRLSLGVLFCLLLGCCCSKLCSLQDHFCMHLSAWICRSVHIEIICSICNASMHTPFGEILEEGKTQGRMSLLCLIQLPATERGAVSSLCL